ncbi:MAG: DEAD/DEAH box helicase [Anaerotignum lactatifermentans]|uniref:DEAD/DEAH box helicase n=1 Tax=Anaerotignum lactatifermentans TaxID=160404 RepID=UPI003999D890
MDHSLFFSNVEKNELNSTLIELLSQFSEEKSVQTYVINAPLGIDASEQYDFNDAVVVLMPKRKICFVNLKEDQDSFKEFCEDFIEDLGYLSEKFEYREQLGRPRAWKKALTTCMQITDISCVDDILDVCKLNNPVEQRNAEFLLSLLIGSINDISRIGGESPSTILDQVKKKIILFDGDQSRFIYSQPSAKKRITIQGLAGTGKTELLLHKLKDLYIKNKSAKIVFTCYNKVLAKSMKIRIPDFFNFMKVDEQIKWNERLWVMSSWGSRGQPNTGVYSYICSNYKLEFHSFSYQWQFDAVCKLAIQELQKIQDYDPCFDYILIDESQDFPQSFFELCELVTKYIVYIAGDIFQDIYDRTINQSVQSDYLLNKCYRTDPKTLMFAHAVGMGLYESPVIRWLDDEEWASCGYKIDRTNSKFILSRIPLRRFEDLDTSTINNIEVVSCDGDNEKIEEAIIHIIEAIRSDHPTVHPGDIAVVFLEGGLKSNYKLADSLAITISKKYSWKAVKGYETKDSTRDAVFISNRNNIKGLEFPFVICLVRGRVTDDVFSRNTIYMMLTRSFITSYFLINNMDANADFIATYKEAAKSISTSGIMCLREPPKEEKERQNQKVSIAVTKNQRSLREIIEEVFAKYPELTTKNKRRIIDSMLEIISEEGSMTEVEIQDRTSKMISAYL